MIKKFTKRAVEIDAMLWDGTESCKDLLCEWSSGKVFTELPEETNLFIETLEGVMKASLGDYIIKGIKGEFYACKPDIFKLTYSPSNSFMETKLESAVFNFNQEPNEQSSEIIELLEITFQSSLGIDNDEGGYFVLKTNSWSVESAQELQKLFDRIVKIMNDAK